MNLDKLKYDIKQGDLDISEYALKHIGFASVENTAFCFFSIGCLTCSENACSSCSANTCSKGCSENACSKGCSLAMSNY